MTHTNPTIIVIGLALSILISACLDGSGNEFVSTTQVRQTGTQAHSDNNEYAWPRQIHVCAEALAT